jgi:transposase-like protein
VIVVPCPERAERILQAGEMSCPRCPGRLRPYGYGRTRTVRGLGDDRVSVTPRRARCPDCAATQILLPATLTVRRADSTETIGTALLAKAHGAGFRTIAATLGRPASTVRRWLRRASEPHAQWLWRKGVQRACEIDRELFTGQPLQQTTLWHALNMLGGAALRYRQRLGLADAPWALIGFFAEGRLLAAPPFS